MGYAQSVWTNRRKAPGMQRVRGREMEQKNEWEAIGGWDISTLYAIIHIFRIHHLAKCGSAPYAWYHGCHCHCLFSVDFFFVWHFFPSLSLYLSPSASLSLPSSSFALCYLMLRTWWTGTGSSFVYSLLPKIRALTFHMFKTSSLIAKVWGFCFCHITCKLMSFFFFYCIFIFVYISRLFGIFPHLVPGFLHFSLILQENCQWQPLLRCTILSLVAWLTRMIAFTIKVSLFSRKLFQTPCPSRSTIHHIVLYIISKLPHQHRKKEKIRRHERLELIGAYHTVNNVHDFRKNIAISMRRKINWISVNFQRITDFNSILHFSAAQDAFFTALKLSTIFHLSPSFYALNWVLYLIQCLGLWNNFASQVIQTWHCNALTFFHYGGCKSNGWESFSSLKMNYRSAGELAACVHCVCVCTKLCAVLSLFRSPFYC